MSIHFRRLASRAFLPSFTPPPATPRSLRLCYLFVPFTSYRSVYTCCISCFVSPVVSFPSRSSSSVCLFYISSLCVSFIILYYYYYYPSEIFVCVSNFFDCSIFVLFQLSISFCFCFFVCWFRLFMIMNDICEFYYIPFEFLFSSSTSCLDHGL